MLVASAVLPVPGWAAITTRSEGSKLEIMASRSSSPDVRSEAPWFATDSSREIALPSGRLMCSASPPPVRWAMARSLDSSSAMRSAGGKSDTDSQEDNPLSALPVARLRNVSA